MFGVAVFIATDALHVVQHILPLSSIKAGADDLGLSAYAAAMDRQQADQVRQLQEAAKLRRDIVFVSDFKAVLATVEGRRFVRRVLAECGVHQSSFCDQPLPMAFKEGRRAIGLWLQSLFVDCPDQYIQLLMEQAKDDDGW